MAVASKPSHIVIGAQVGVAGKLTLVITFEQLAVPQLFVTV
jgi:hypothetical protein